MNKTKKTLVILLVLALMLSVFASCNKTSTDTSEPEKTVTEEATKAAADETADEPEVPAREPGNPELPIVSEPVTFTIWHPTSTDIASVLDNLGDSEYYKELEKRTGVHLEFTHPAIGQEQEALNLMIGSGDYPDIIQMDKGSYWYPGGLDKAYSDGVLIRLNDLVESDAPNLWKLINSDNELWKGSVTDSGNILGIYTLIPEMAQPPWIGMVLRQDWLDDLNLEVPTTYDDWHTVLTAFKEEKGAIAPLMVQNNGFSPFDFFNGGYGVGQAFYQVDGTVKYGPIEDGCKDYVTMMSQWFSEGLIDPDFATKKDFIPATDYTTTGKAGAWYDIYILLSVRAIQSGSDTYKAAAAPSPAINEGDAVHFKNYNLLAGNTCWTVSSQCEDPETLIRWLDYLFSPDGSLLTSYGFEGQTYELNDEGQPAFTEFMYANPDGHSLSQMMALYCKPPSGAMEYHWERELAGQPDVNLNAMDVWNANNDGAYYLPGITMTYEESSEYAQIMGDIETLVNETIIQYIMGLKPLSEYESFVEQIKSMDIARAMEIQQNALDRYNER